MSRVIEIRPGDNRGQAWFVGYLPNVDGDHDYDYRCRRMRPGKEHHYEIRASPMDGHGCRKSARRQYAGGRAER